jgi:hypothetical protein
MLTTDGPHSAYILLDLFYELLADAETGLRRCQQKHNECGYCPAEVKRFLEIVHETTGWCLAQGVENLVGSRFGYTDVSKED